MSSDSSLKRAASEEPPIKIAKKQKKSTDAHDSPPEQSATEIKAPLENGAEPQEATPVTCADTTASTIPATTTPEGSTEKDAEPTAQFPATSGDINAPTAADTTTTRDTTIASEPREDNEPDTTNEKTSSSPVLPSAGLQDDTVDSGAASPSDDSVQRDVYDDEDAEASGYSSPNAAGFDPADLPGAIPWDPLSEAPDDIDRAFEQSYDHFEAMMDSMTKEQQDNFLFAEYEIYSDDSEETAEWKSAKRAELEDDGGW